MSCHFLLHGIFPTQGSNSGPLHWELGDLATESQENPLLLVLMSLVYPFIATMQLEGFPQNASFIKARCLKPFNSSPLKILLLLLSRFSRVRLCVTP